MSYLGRNLPLSSLKVAVDKTAPTNLLLFLVHYDLPEKVEEYLNILNREFSNRNIYLSGNETLLKELNVPERLNRLTSVVDLEQLI